MKLALSESSRSEFWQVVPSCLADADQHGSTRWYATRETVPVLGGQAVRLTDPKASNLRPEVVEFQGHVADPNSEHLRRFVADHEPRGQQFDWAFDWVCHEDLVPLDVAFALGAIRRDHDASWPSGSPLNVAGQTTRTESGRPAPTCYGGPYGRGCNRKVEPQIKLYRADLRHGYLDPTMRLEVTVMGHGLCGPWLEAWAASETEGAKIACGMAQKVLGVTLPWNHGPYHKLTAKRCEPSLSGAIRHAIYAMPVIRELLNAGIDFHALADLLAFYETRDTQRKAAQHKDSIARCGHRLPHALEAVVRDVRGDGAALAVREYLAQNCEVPF